MGFDFGKYEQRIQKKGPRGWLQKFNTVEDYTKLFQDCFVIKSESGGAIAFELRRPQRRFLRLYLAARKKGNGIRIVHLKARQYGGSTLIQALLLLDAIEHNDATLLTVAHDADSASHLLMDMSEYMADRLCSDFKIRVKKTRQKPHPEYILSNGSKITAVTAKNLNLGRSKTFRFLHLSEVAFWWRTLQTFEAADDIFQSVMSTVPEPTEVPDAAVILESTGYGRQGAFYEYYVGAKEGKTNWIPFFVPWYEIEKYHFQITEDEKENAEVFQETMARLRMGENVSGEVVDVLGLDRHELQLMHDTIKQETSIDPTILDWGHILWRRNKLGDFRGDIDRFKQEYPASEDDAFNATGTPAFSPNAMIWYEDRTKALVDKKTRYEIIPIDGVPHVMENVNGFLWVWEQPEKKGQYIVGADVAAGDSAHKFRPSKASYSAAQVLRVDDGHIRQVAEYMARPDPIEFGQILYAIGTWYNSALVVVERNADGLSTISELLHMDYPEIYQIQKSVSRDGEVRVVYGVQTDPTNKKAMLNLFRYLASHKDVEIMSARLVQQMHTVHYTPDGRIVMPRAADLVMSFIIGLTVANEELTNLIEDQANEEKEEGNLIWDPELGLVSRWS